MRPYRPDHPRVCGANTPEVTSEVSGSGSSPRVRGKQSDSTGKSALRPQENNRFAQCQSVHSFDQSRMPPYLAYLRYRETLLQPVFFR